MPLVRHKRSQKPPVLYPLVGETNSRPSAGMTMLDVFMRISPRKECHDLQHRSAPRLSANDAQDGDLPFCVLVLESTACAVPIFEVQCACATFDPVAFPVTSRRFADSSRACPVPIDALQ